MTAEDRPSSSPLLWIMSMAAWGAFTAFGLSLIVRSFGDTFLAAPAENLIVAHIHLLQGCVVLVLAAIADWWLSAPVAAWVLVIAPTLVLGAIAINDPLYPPNLAIAIAVPLIVSGLISSLIFARPMRRWPRLRSRSL